MIKWVDKLRTFRISHRCLLLLLVLIFNSVQISASNAHTVVSSNASIYKEISLLCIEQGSAMPSSSGPWTMQELLLMVGEIDRAKLSRTGQIRYDAVQAQLGLATVAPALSFSAVSSLQLNLEGYAHTNATAFAKEDDWFYENEKRSPIAIVDGQAWIGDQFYLYSNFGIKNNRFATEDPDSNAPSDTLLFSPHVSTNLIKSGTHDFDTPSRAFLAFGGEHYSLQFGRDLISWGYGTTGNLIIGDHVKYHEFLKLSLFSKQFKFTNLIMFMDPPGYITKNRDPYYPDDKTVPTVRMFLAHRFEFTPIPPLRIEVSENVMYQDTTFNMKYLNPLFIYHNLSNRGQFNAIADITVTYTLRPNLAMYATWVIDQVAAPGEGNDQPNAMAYQVGLRTLFPRETGYWSLTSEFVYTDPYLYLRDHVDFIVMTRERDQCYGYVPHYEFLGYQYGGDALVGLLQAEWNGNGACSAGGEVFYMAHGATTKDTEFVFGEMEAITTPSSPTIHTLRLGLWGSYRAERLPISLWARIDAINRWDSSHQVDVQVAAGISYTL